MLEMVFIDVRSLKIVMPGYSVEARKVTKVYRSGSIEVDALTDVSFSLEQGDFAAIVGPSGSGKSTLMNILGTIDKPTKGEIYIDGVPTSKMDGNKLAEFRNRKLGFIFQAFNLINGLDAEKNAELPLMVDPMPQGERQKKADALLTKLGLGNRLKLNPTQLSGGERSGDRDRKGVGQGSRADTRGRADRRLGFEDQRGCGRIARQHKQGRQGDYNNGYSQP